MSETVSGACPALIENGFVEVGAGKWLAAPDQPAAFFGTAARRRRKGWFLADRSALDLIETDGKTFFSSGSAPFLTYLTVASPIRAVSSKVLVAPAEARTGAEFVRAIPMSSKGGVCATSFGTEWLVLATKSRVRRIVLEDGDTLSARTDAVVAWTGQRPTGFCPKLGLLDVLLPRGPKDILFHFHGPSVVWIEGSSRVSALRRITSASWNGRPFAV